MSQATMGLSVQNPPPARPQPVAGTTVTDDSRYEEAVIQPNRGWIGVNWHELYTHRELLFFLVWRDVKVKYKQAIFGPVWAIVVPLVSVLIYTIVGQFAGFARTTNENGVPYPVYVYAGLLPWLFLNTAISSGGMSLITNQTLLSKIYLPRLFIPTATIGTAIVDMFMSGIVFVGMVLLYMAKTHGQFHPGPQIVFLPLLFIPLMLSALGTAYFLSALTVMFRDLRFIIPFITQLGIWLTAVVYPQSIFTVRAEDPVTHQPIRDALGHVILLHDFRPWLALNPYAGIVQAFRWAIVRDELQTGQLIASCIWSVVLLIGGLFYFKRVERRFADIA